MPEFSGSNSKTALRLEEGKELVGQTPGQVGEIKTLLPEAKSIEVHFPQREEKSILLRLLGSQFAQLQGLMGKDPSARLIRLHQHLGGPGSEYPKKRAFILAGPLRTQEELERPLSQEDFDRWINGPLGKEENPFLPDTGIGYISGVKIVSIPPDREELMLEGWWPSQKGSPWYTLEEVTAAMRRKWEEKNSKERGNNPKKF